MPVSLNHSDAPSRRALLRSTSAFACGWIGWLWFLGFCLTFPSPVHAQDPTPSANQVLDLGGTPGFLELPADRFNRLTAATVEAWVRFDRLARGRLFDFGKESQAMAVGTVDHQPDLRFEIWDAEQKVHTITVAGVVATQRWCHVAAVSGPGGMRLYLNGQLIGSDPYPGSFSSVGDGSRNRLGRSNWSEGDLMDQPDAVAQIDDFAVWDHERGEDQIRRSLRSGIRGDEAGLVGWWHFDDGTSRDASKQGQHGRLMGTARTRLAPHPATTGPLHQSFLHGTVSGPGGEAVAGANVRVFREGHLLRSAITDPKGAYRIHLLPAESQLDLQAERSAQGSWRTNVTVESIGGRRVDLRLGPVSRVSGRVTALDVTPQGSVVVQAVRLGSPRTPAGPLPVQPTTAEATSMTDPLGRYQFTHLRPGTYGIRIHAPGRLLHHESFGALHVADGQSVTNVDFRIAPFKKGTWRTFNSHEGLPSLGVRTLHQDPDGILWIGTRNGLSRFDGTLMRSYSTEDGLAGNDIASITRDPKGILWIASENGGLSQLAGDRFIPGTPDGLMPAALHAVHADRQGRIWAGGPGLYSLSGAGVVHHSETSGFPAEEVYKIASGADGRLWCATDEGLVSFDGNRFVNVTLAAGIDPFVADSPKVAPDGSIWFGSWGRGVWRHDPAVTNGPSLRNWTTADGLADNVVWSVEFAPDGTVWMATLNGVSRFDGTSFLRYTRDDGLADNHVSVIHRDPHGILWFATQAGLTRHDPDTTVTYTTADGLVSNAIRSSARGSDGHLWFATDRGLSRWDGVSFRNYTTKEGLPVNEIRDVAARKDGTICVVTTSGIGWFDGARYTPLGAPEATVRNIVCVDVAPDGTIAAGTFGGELLRWIDPRKAASVETVGDGAYQGVVSILCLSSNEVWLGLNGGGGIVRIHPGPGDGRSVREQRTHLRVRDGLTDDYGMALTSDRAGAVWMGGATGLSRFTTNGISRFNRRRQAAGEEIHELYEDSRGLLWVARKSGVRFSDGLAWSNLDDRDGLPANEVHTVVEGSDGAVWFGTDRGVARHRRWIEVPPVPRLALRGSPNEGREDRPPVVSTEAPSSFRWQLTEFRTSPENRMFRWQVTGGSLSAPALKADVGWSEPEPGSEVEWSTNRAGLYTLAVQFIDRNLNRSAPQTLTFEVRSPWFRNPAIMVPLLGLHAGLLGWGVYGGVLFLRNRREARRLQERVLEEERKAREAAETANKAKSLFLASMSHELRTPLNAIIGYSELVQEELEDANQGALVPDLQRINSAARHQLSLVNDLLDFSKIEAGKMTLFVEEFEVAPVIREVEATVLPLFTRNGNRLELDCPSNLGRARTDQTRLRQILFNLLSNAAKFTQKGVIRLSASRGSRPITGIATDPAATQLVFQVIDTGMGMSPEQLTRLFRAFSQAEADTAKKFGGTGLGLALSRQFAEMMGGTLTVESQHAIGSTFTLVIPVEAPEQTVGPQSGS